MTCKDCVHYDVCGESIFTCGQFKDKSKFIELPCKVGDIIYRIQYVDDTNILLRGIGIKEYVFNLSFYGLHMSEFGKTIFLTKEEAEAKLKELNEK